MENDVFFWIISIWQEFTVFVSSQFLARRHLSQIFRHLCPIYNDIYDEKYILSKITNETGKLISDTSDPLRATTTYYDNG